MTRQLRPCGTGAAVRRHIRRGEPLDDECREAHNACRREQRRTGQYRLPVNEQAIDAAEHLARDLAVAAAPTLAAAVHRRNADTIAAVLLPLDAEQLRALAVVLADHIVIDDVAVDRALGGDEELARSLTRPERAAAIARLAEQGHGPTHASERLHMNSRTAKRLYEALPTTTRPRQEGTAA
jgi:hypothetical protein